MTFDVGAKRRALMSGAVDKAVAADIRTAVDPYPTTGHLRSWQMAYLGALLALDGAAWVLSSILGEIIAFGVSDPNFRVGRSFLPYLLVAVILTLLWCAALAVSGAYDRQKVGFGSEEYRSVVNGAIRFLALLAIVHFSLKTDLARSFVFIAWPTATMVTLLVHYGARRWLHHQRQAGNCLRRTLLVGNHPHVAEISGHFSRAPYAGISVVGACIEGLEDALNTPVDVNGTVVMSFATSESGLSPDDVILALEKTQATVVAIADAQLLADESLRPLAYELEKRDAELIVIPSVTTLAGPRIVVHPVGGLPLLHIAKPGLTPLPFHLKSFLERALSLTLLLFLAPVLLAIAFAIWGSTGRPIVFKQLRVGQHGEPFDLYKFRTMSTDAEDQLHRLRAYNESDGPLFKLAHDPRVTPIGRFLRRWSLDELPQLWNVVKGEMALVGPRPPLRPEAEYFGHDARRRFLVKPGVTGLWQISGRAALPWTEAVRLDLYYIENWSWSLDLVILAKTTLAIIRAEGAY